MSVAFSLAIFGIGVALVIWATERLLEGLVGLAWLLRVSAFAVAAILSGFEAENVAVGLAAARRGAEEVALGTVFGGVITRDGTRPLSQLAAELKSPSEIKYTSESCAEQSGAAAEWRRTRLSPRAHRFASA